jgi:hypothetical protein
MITKEQLETLRLENVDVKDKWALLKNSVTNPEHPCFLVFKKDDGVLTQTGPIIEESDVLMLLEVASRNT